MNGAASSELIQEWLAGQAPKHSAKWSKALLPVVAQWLGAVPLVLDPFSGVGDLWRIRKHGFEGQIWLNELQPRWAIQALGYVERIVVGDALNMVWLKDGAVPAVATSPTFGNRQADHHNARDGSKRRGYKFDYGEDLDPRNSGTLYWGPEYRAFHTRAWAEVWRVLAPGGLFILNIKDFIRDGTRVPVEDWHKATALAQGFAPDRDIRVQTTGNRHGQNHEARVDGDRLFLFRKPFE